MRTVTEVGIQFNKIQMQERIPLEDKGFFIKTFFSSSYH